MKSTINELSIEDLEWIDGVCIDFEKQWQSGDTPQIEIFVESSQAHLRRPLLIELLKLDIDYRRLKGENPTREKYLSRFPSETPAINNVFSETASSSGQNHLLPPGTDIKLNSRYSIERFFGARWLG